MPNSKAKQARVMKENRAEKKRLAGAHLLSKWDVRAMRKAGLRVGDLQGEEGARVSFQTFSALLRDRDALKAHMAWHHESMKYPDVATIVERVLAHTSIDPKVLQERILALEAEVALHEAEHGITEEVRYD